MTDSALVLLSGGMDSTVLAAHSVRCNTRTEAITVNYGQRHAVEMQHARTVAAALDIRLDVLDFSGLGAHLGGSALTDADVEVPDGHYAEPTMRSTIVPNRNAILVMSAVGIAQSRGISTVALAVHAGDHHVYPDCRPEAVAVMSDLALVCTEGAVDVVAPFVEWTKTDIARHGAGIGAPLHLTWSCYKGGAAHCGTCGTCTERREAFRDAGIDDPTIYREM